MTGEKGAHTAGPWLLNREQNGWDANAEYSLWSRGDDGVIHQIALFSAEYDDIKIPAKENATLAMASPDLLGVVLEVRRLICEAAEEGFNPLKGTWAERLYKTQAVSYEAVKKAGVDPRAATAAASIGELQ